MLRFQNQDTASQAYSSESAQKIIAMAGRLQDAASDHVVTVAEMEKIAEEVGVRPEFVRQALEAMRLENVAIEEAKSQQQKKVVVLQTKTQTPTSERPSIDKMWWAIAWVLMPVAGILGDKMNFDELAALAPFIYVGVGIFLSMLLKKSAPPAVPAPPAETAATSNINSPASREALLERLFELQQQLESTRTRRAFLSVDVVSSTELKRDNAALPVEYTFGQYRRWVEEVVQAEGGQCQVAAGDGMMCLFPDDVRAVRAAQKLLEDLPRFNAQQNRLSRPIHLRCGINAGDIALEPGVPIGHLQSPVIDYAALLQKAAEPDTLLVSGTITPVALAKVGGFSPATPIAGEVTYTWRPGA